MRASEIRASHLKNDLRVQDPYCLRCQPQVMGVRRSACCVTRPTRSRSRRTPSPIIRSCSRHEGEALSGGNFHAEPVAFAADAMAIAICEIGSLAERRISLLVDPVLSGLPAFLAVEPGLNSGS